MLIVKNNNCNNCNIIWTKTRETLTHIIKRTVDPQNVVMFFVKYIISFIKNVFNQKVTSLHMIPAVGSKEFLLFLWQSCIFCKLEYFYRVMIHSSIFLTKGLKFISRKSVSDYWPIISLMITLCIHFLVVL